MVGFEGHENGQKWGATQTSAAKHPSFHRIQS